MFLLYNYMEWSKTIDYPATGAVRVLILYDPKHATNEQALPVIAYLLACQLLVHFF